MKQFYLFGIAVIILFPRIAVAEDPQVIHQFRLSNFGLGGQQSWELEGDTAKILSESIELTGIKAKTFTKDQEIRLKAREGTYRKQDSTLYLKHDVVITGQQGARLTTESLLWDQLKDSVTSDDNVQLVRQNLVAYAQGLYADTTQESAVLKKDVTVEINEEDTASKTVITCDGPLQIDYAAEMAQFNTNVKIDNPQGELYADQAKVFFAFKDKEIVKMEAEGNVKIVRGKSTAYAKKAIYDQKAQKLSLQGSPKLVIFSQEKSNLGF